MSQEVNSQNEGKWAAGTFFVLCYTIYMLYILNKVLSVTKDDPGFWVLELLPFILVNALPVILWWIISIILIIIAFFQIIRDSNWDKNIAAHKESDDISENKYI